MSPFAQRTDDERHELLDRAKAGGLARSDDLDSAAKPRSHALDRFELDYERTLGGALARRSRRRSAVLSLDRCFLHRREDRPRGRTESYGNGSVTVKFDALARLLPLPGC